MGLPRDLDVVVVVRRRDKKTLAALRSATDEVLRRYSFATMEFFSVWDYSPSPVHLDYSRFPVQVIVHDEESAGRTSPFIRYDRVLRHIDNYGDLEMYLGPADFGPQQVVEDPRGLAELIGAIQSHEVPSWRWTTDENENLVRDDFMVSLKNTQERRDYLRYALRWSAVNSLRSVGDDFRGESTAAIRHVVERLKLGKGWTTLEATLAIGGEIDWNARIDEMETLGVAFISRIAESLRRRGGR